MRGFCFAVDMIYIIPENLFLIEAWNQKNLIII